MANLAITFANMGKKTLLIDGDLRRPVLHTVFNIEKTPGLTEHLVDSIKDPNEIIVRSEVKNLSIIPSGTSPPNPSELLGSKHMISLLSQMEDQYDIVLLDSPPLIAVTDASLISREIDGMVLVIHSGKTDKHGLDRTISAISNINVPLIGVVLNSVTSKNSYGSYYYYYQNYSYNPE